ncbi:DivIVA domain-containing protein [Agrococcus sp. ProA11]|uniref:DivIVA domain-containing protein n=1 Tax=Agrococcus chionoecetis TaxID=3153752 RepID=UPI003261341D
MLTADEVLNARFTTGGTLYAGYDAHQVDDWLDRVISTLRAHEGEADGDVQLLAEDAQQVRFRMLRGAGAYDTVQVDDVIDRIASALVEHEA